MSSKLEQLQALLAPVIEALGYQCWGIEFLSQGRHSLLRVYIDKADGITVDDCAVVSREVSALLDVEDPIPNEYTLEVSSPGMDRPLFTEAQFTQYVGQKIEVKLTVPQDGRRKFKGLLTSFDGDMLVIEVDGKPCSLLFDNIDKANVVPVF